MSTANVGTWRARLLVGVVLWAFAVAMTPHEIAAAKTMRPIDARTIVALVAYLAAALLVLSGIPWRPKASEPDAAR